MPTLAWPTLARGKPAEMSWRLLFNNQLGMESPFSRSVQTLEQAGSRWAVHFVLLNRAEADWRLLEAWLAQLRGMAGRFTLYDFSAPNPRGTIGTAGVTVNGAVAQGAATATFAGAGNAKTLLRGDKFGVAGEVKIVVGADFTSDAAGAMASVTFEPPVRASAGWSSGAAVTLASPTATFMLTADSVEKLVRVPKLANVPIDAVEAY